VIDVAPTGITGNVSGRTEAVISTGTKREDQHFHLIQKAPSFLEDLFLSGTENNGATGHQHLVSIE
jgi:hypothetical protein